MFSAASPRSHSEQRRVPAARVRRHERDRRRRAGDVAGVRPDRRQRPQALAVLDDDEVPALLVLGAGGVAPGVDDPLEVLRRERAAVEAPDHRASFGSRPDVHQASSTARGRRRWRARRSSAAPGSGRRGSRRRTTRASDRKPPGSSSSAVSRSGSGRRSAGTAAATASASAGGADRRAPSRGTARPRRGTPRTRTASCAGRPRRAASRSRRPGRARPAGRGEPGQVADGTTRSSSPWMSRTGPGDVATARVAQTDRTVWPRGPEEDVRRQPGERPGERRRGSAAGRGGTSGASAGTGPRASTPRPRRRRASLRGRDQRARGAHRVAQDRRPRDLRPARAARATAGRASAPNSPAVSGSSSGAFAPCPRTSNVSTWKPAACRICAFGSVRSRADSQPWTSRTPGPLAPPRPGSTSPGSRRPSGRDLDVLEGEAERVRRPDGRVPVRVAGADAVRLREPPGDATGSAASAAARPARRTRRRWGTACAMRTVKRGRLQARPPSAVGTLSSCPRRIPMPCSASSPAPAPTTSRPPGADSPASTTRTSPATTRRRPARDPPDGRDQPRLRGADPSRRDHRGARAAARTARGAARHGDPAARRRPAPADAAAAAAAKPTRPSPAAST